MRYVGVKDNKICLVSNSPIENPDLQTIQVPGNLDHVSNTDLLSYCRIQNGQLVSKLSKKSAKEMKVALVSNWRMKCGISIYLENLCTALIPYIGDFKLFVEQNDQPTGVLNEINGQLIPEDKMIACWKRGESLIPLADEIKKYDPDIVLINHEWGIWPNARYWLSLMTQLSNYRVIVIMHSVFHHKDKTIVESAIPEIVVHLEGAKKVLEEEKQVSGKVSVIPHGCVPCTNDAKLWNFYKSKRTFLQFGFGFRYKNFQSSIEATSLLKEKYPDIFFTGLFSDSAYNKSEHDRYFNELLQTIEDLKIQDNVAIVRGYQSDQSMDSYIRTNTAAVFPYSSNKEHECYGSSGAALYTMTKGIPLITSTIHHFYNLPTLKADTPQEIANHLDQLFTDNNLIKSQVKVQNQYLLENSWEKIALKYIDLFENA